MPRDPGQNTADEKRDHDGLWGGELVRTVRSVGRTALERLPEPVRETPDGPASVILSVDGAPLLVLGLALPVVVQCRGPEYRVLEIDVEVLKNRVNGVVPPPLRMAAQTFGPLPDHVGSDDLIRCFPSAAAAGERAPALLGIRLVTLHPLDPASADQWPDGPDELVGCVRAIEGALTPLFAKLDSLLLDAGDRRGCSRRSSGG